MILEKYTFQFKIYYNSSFIYFIISEHCRCATGDGNTRRCDLNFSAPTRPPFTQARTRSSFVFCTSGAMAPTPASMNNELSAVYVDDVLAVLNEMLPTIDLDFTPRREIQQILADHFGVMWDDIHVHAGAIPEASFEKNFELNGPVSQGLSGESGDVRNEAVPEPDVDLPKSDDDENWNIKIQASCEDEVHDATVETAGLASQEGTVAKVAVCRRRTA